MDVDDRAARVGHECGSDCTTFPLSLVQESMWTVDELDPGSVANHFGSAALIRSPIDPALLRRAVEIIAERHPMLTATFDAVDGETVQTVHAGRRGAIEIVDARQWGDADVHARIEAEALRTFDLRRGPPVRFVLLTRADELHVLIVRFHHIAADMWSAAVVIGGLADVYAALAGGATDIPTSVERTTYADFVGAEQRSLAGPDAASHRAYWRERLAGLQPVRLPASTDPVGRRSGRGSRVVLRLDSEDTDAVRRAARRCGTSAFHLAVAALELLVGSLTGRTDVVVGTLKFNRSSRNAQTVGCFVQPVVLRTDLGGAGELADVVQRVDETFTSAAPHESYPLPQVVDDLRMRLAPGAALFQVLCSWQRMSRSFDRGVLSALFHNWPDRHGLVGGWLMESVEAGSSSAPYDLSVLLADDRDELVVTVEHRDDAFTTEEARHFAEQYVALLRAIAHDPDGAIADLPLPSPAHRAATTSLRADPPAPTAAPDPQLLATVTEIWQSVLGVDVSATDDFFELGGHSLLATRIVSRVRDRLGVEVAVRALFDAPTVASFSAAVAAALAAPARRRGDDDARRAPAPAPAPTNVTRSWATDVGAVVGSPLSSSQQRMWFVHRLQPDGGAYNLAAAVRLRGPLDAGALQRALDGLVARHDSLRTRFVIAGGEPRQIVEASAAVPVGAVDLREVPSGEADARLHAELARAGQLPFDLATLPLLRATLYRTAADDVVLLLVVHHIVSDQWSFGVISTELSEIYNAAIAGVAPALPVVDVQHREFERRRLEDVGEAALADQLAYWRCQLDGLTPLEVPADRPRPPVATGHGANIVARVPAGLWPEVQRLAVARRVSPFMVMFAAFVVLLRRHAATDDIAVGSPIANRNSFESEHIISSLVNTVVLRVDASGTPTFDELVDRVRSVALDAFEHQDVPFEEVVEDLHPRRDLSRSPLFQVFFNVQNAPLELPHLVGVAATAVDVPRRAAQFDISLSIDTAVELKASLEYNTDLYEASSMEAFVAHYWQVLTAAVSGPHRSIEDLEMNTAAESAALDREWASTDVALDAAATVHGGFEAQVRATPDRIAVRFAQDRLTYVELDQRANRLARHLRATGVGNGDLVGIHLDRSHETLVAVLAVLKAGAAYVPLDPGFPPERLALMVADSGLRVVVTQSWLTPIAPDLAAILVDREGATIGALDPAPLESTVSGGDLAYVIYTSGSTGRPKGVQVEHGAVVNFLTAMTRRPGLAAGDVLVSVTTLSFDISVLELLGPLQVGATVVVVPREATMDGNRLGSILAETAATVMQATPTTWRLLFESGWTGSLRLRVLCGGEAMPPDLASALTTACAEVWNMYGPTETTVWSSVYRVRGTEATIPIGEPIDNTQLYVLDDRRRPVPTGVPGELYIAGAGVARGYLGRADLDAERFLPDPFRVRGSRRMYRTGDLVRRTSQGAVEFLGRIDRQVKVRGHRIELGEIEAVIAALASVAEVVVDTQTFGPGDVRLVAYVVPATGHPVPSDTDVRRQARALLPDYMVPTSVVVLDALPLTPNNKIDRAALAGRSVATASAVREPPRPGTERVVAGIWSAVIGVADISRDADFFDLGGHSLLAIRMFAEVERRTGRTLPLTALFRAPTVAGFAQLLEDGDEPSAWTSLVAIRAEGSRPPFFHVSPFLISVLSFSNLARHLGPDQPLYGLQPQGMDGAAPIHDRVEDMAAHYISEMRMVQPAGPYAIGGHCAGSWVAFEMARQLQAAGEVVRVLVLVDSEPPGIEPPPTGRLRYLWERLRFYWRDHRLLDALRWRRGLLVQRYLVRRLGTPERRRVAGLRQIHAAAHARYRPGGAVRGDATLIRSQESASLPDKQWHQRWEELFTGELHTVVIPGTHAQLVDDVNSEDVAKVIEAVLRTA